MNFLNYKGGGKFPLFLFTMTISLLGCGGESGEGGAGSSPTTNTDSETVTLSAQDATYSTDYKELFEVDLSAKVFSSTGGGFTLSDVEILSNHDSCVIESIADTSFVIQALDSKVCDYRYYVMPKSTSSMAKSDSQGASSAIARVAVSSEPDATELVPISATTLINEGISVSLESELNKVGFTLGDEFVLTELTLPYSFSSSAEINDLDPQTIDYTPPQGFSGIDRVLYTLEDAENGLVLMGVLDVAIGHEANQGFSIDENIEYPDMVDVFVETEIDISDFVSSEDGDDYQLVYVESFNAEVAPKDPLDITNKSIIFMASDPGFHYISFGVTDHNGAYDMGLIQVTVTDPNQSAKWEDIYHQVDRYTAPPTSLDAVRVGAVYDIKLTEYAYSPEIDMAGFRYPSAVNYCDLIGAELPTVDQLTQMTSDISVQTLHNWPVQAQYIVHGDTTEEPMWVELADGATSSGIIDPVGYYYVTCITQGVMEVLPTSSTQTVANGVDTAVVYIELKLGDEARPDTIISATVDSTNVTLESDSVMTDSNGIAEFRLTSFKAETVTLTVELDGVTETHDIKFIGDEETAAVTSQTTIDDVQYQSAGAQVVATLTDENGNPVEGYSVNSEASIETHPNTGQSVAPIIEPESTQTDGAGQQKMRVKWDTSYEIPTTNMTFDVTSSYTTTTNTLTEAVSQVTFNAYVCGGEVGNQSTLNAKGSCVKIMNLGGDLYTGSPSVNFLTTSGYTGYYLTFDESHPDGDFGRIKRDDAFDVCRHYNDIELNGLSNWYMPNLDEVEALWDSGNGSPMANRYGWADDLSYWTSSTYYPDNISISLKTGVRSDFSDSVYAYVTCISRG